MSTLPPGAKADRSLFQFFRNNWLFISGTLLLVVFNVLMLLMHKQGDALVAINKLRTPFWDVFFKIGTHFAEPEAYGLAILLVTAFSYRKGIFIVVTGACAGITAGILKLLFAQPRPMRWFFDNYLDVWYSLNLFEEEWRSWAEASSFPSGHATSAFALYSFLAFNARRGKLSISTLCLLLAAMVAFSRMYLLYHFLRDVTVGAGLGLCLGALVYYLQKASFKEAKWMDRGWLDIFKSS